MACQAVLGHHMLVSAWSARWHAGQHLVNTMACQAAIGKTLPRTNRLAELKQDQQAAACTQELYITAAPVQTEAIGCATACSDVHLHIACMGPNKASCQGAFKLSTSIS
eukprot:scaffold16816_cov20-Tisochrysis_lutea.AAC.2